MTTTQTGVISKILDRIVPVLVLAPMGECWIWVARTNRNGYGRLYHQGEEKMAHRVAYEQFIGPIPEGLLLDHCCRTRCCVNPAHLEPVTHQINTLRGKAQLFGRDVDPLKHRRTSWQSAPVNTMKSFPQHCKQQMLNKVA